MKDINEKIKKAKGYYINALEKRDMASFGYETKRYKQMVANDYYEIFNLCRVIYSIEEQNTSKHKTLLGNFNKVFVHERQEFDKAFGTFLHTLEKMRGLCDYEANYEIHKDFAIYLHEQTDNYSNLLLEYIAKHYPTIIQLGNGAGDENENNTTNISTNNISSSNVGEKKVVSDLSATASEPTNGSFDKVDSLEELSNLSPPKEVDEYEEDFDIEM